MTDLETTRPGGPALPALDSVSAQRTPPDEWHGAWIVARREMRDLLNDWRILGPALLLVVVFPLLLVVITAQGYALALRRHTDFDVPALIPFATLLVAFLPVSFSLMIALESFAGERERNTLEALLATPLGDRALYLGKLIASLIPPLVGSYISMVLYLGGTIATMPYKPPWGVIGALGLLNLGQAGIMVAGALIMSSHTTSVRAANLLAAFIILPMSIIIQLSNALILWGGAGALIWIALGLGVFAVLLIRMGLRLFNREQILAREMDNPQPGRLTAAVRLLWRLSPRQALLWRTPAADLTPARPFSLRRLYRRDIPALLCLRWPELLLVGLALVVALGIGYGLAHSYPLDMQRVTGGGTLAGGQVAGQLQSVTGSSRGLLLDLLLSVPNVLARLLLVSVLLILLAVISFGTLPLLVMILLATGVGFVFGQLAAAGTSPLALGVVLLTPSVLFPALAVWLLAAFAARFGLVVAGPPPGFSLGDSLLLALVEYAKILALAFPLMLIGQMAQVVLLAVARSVLGG